MTFPTLRLDLTVELAFGADLDATPLGWTWTDVTSRLRSIGGEPSVRITRGRPDEASETNPSTCSFTLDNNDGELTPTNTASAWYPDVKRGTPVRVWAEGATPALLLTGAANSYASTPDHTDFDFAGDFDIRIKCLPFQWAGATDVSSETQTLVARDDGAGARSWRLESQYDGEPLAAVSTDGTAWTGRTSSNAVEGLMGAVRPRWVGVVYDADNAAATGTFKHYSWEGDGDPPADITTWDLVKDTADTPAGPGAVANVTAGVQVGAANGTPDFQGVVYELQIRSGINGTVVADPDFTSVAAGSPSVTDSTSKVWTVQSGASISTRRPRFVGTVDDLALQWPYGDNQAGNAAADSECWVEVEAAGILRRLSQGSKPIRSVLYRHATTAPQASSHLWAYWAMEEGDRATVAASGRVSTDADMTLTGFTGTDDSLPASGPLPVLPSDVVGNYSSTVTNPGTFFDNWAAAFVYRMPEPEPASAWTELLTVQTEGTAATWTLSVNSGDFRLQAFNSTPTLLFTDTQSFGGHHDWVLVTIFVRQTGGNMQWDVDAIAIDNTFTFNMSDVFAGTVGKPTGIDTDITGPPAGLTIGHVMLFDGFVWLTPGWVEWPAVAYAGETAAARFRRLCWEEGVPVEVVGDYLGDRLGDIAKSEAMGPQKSAPLLEVLTECARIDGGAIVERVGFPGLVYRTRRDMEAQSPGLALDASTDGVRPGLRFTNDDSRLRNDVTVKAVNGSTATAVDAASVAASGRYDTQVEVNGVGGINLGYAGALKADRLPLVNVQNARIADRLLYRGTWEELRCRGITTELSIAPTYLPAWHGLAMGDRVTLTGLPAQWPAAVTVDLLLESIEETLTPTRWATQMACSPGGPWTQPWGLFVEAALAAELTTVSDATVGSILAVQGTPAWVNGDGNQTVTNPDSGGSGTMIAIAVMQGTTNAPTLTITPPPGVSTTTIISDASSLFRVSAWTYANDGANKTFGASGGSDNRCSCILIPLDGTAATTDVSTAVEASSTSVGFNSVTTQTDDLLITLITRRDASDTGAPSGYTIVDTDVAEATTWRSGAHRTLATGGPTTTPPTITWTGAGPKRQYALRFRA